MSILIPALIIFAIALVMTMTGRGGGNFYVLALVLSGLTMHEAASTGQFILFVSSVSATLVFGRAKNVEWKLVLFIGGITAISAFFGGLLADNFSGRSLKFVFSFLLVIAAFVMLRPVTEGRRAAPGSRGIWRLKSDMAEYEIDLKIALPVILVSGFCAGMVGVSGGSFLVPLMVLACGVPMNIAVGTSTTMVAGTALMGFAGHAMSGHVELLSALPLAAAAAAGGLIGGYADMNTKTAVLKKIFAYTTFLASAVMIFNAVLTK